jgi:hypothetical protein
MKKVFVVLIIGMLFSVIPIVDGQLTLGQKANQKSIELFVDKSEIIEVKHVISPSKMPVTVNLFEGVTQNSIEVKNEDGEEKEIGIGNDGKGNVSITIFPTVTQTIIKYNVTEQSSLTDNLWTVKAKYNETYSVLFPEEIKFIFLNNNLIPLENRDGISVNGGGEIKVEYYSMIPKSIQKVQWEENKFDVKIISDLKIERFNFDQESKSISFEINEKDEFVTVGIPQELLWGPYVIMLDDEKIHYGKSFESENIVLLYLKPETTGQVTIIGTTVIPEFSMFIPLIMGFIIILTVPTMRKFSLR